MLVQASATLGRVANEVYHLQRTEIDEVREGRRAGQVGSSTMPHKQNPSTVDLISALSRLVRAQMVALTDAAFQLHERDGTTWRIEWAALPELFIYAGALLARMEGLLLAGLEVREARMRSNLDLLGGLILSERVMLALAPRCGKQTAHHLVHDIALQAQDTGVCFRDALLGDSRLQGCFSPQTLDELLDPSTYTGWRPRWSIWWQLKHCLALAAMALKRRRQPQAIPVSPSTRWRVCDGCANIGSDRPCILHRTVGPPGL